jgi:hypothetical protein
VENLNKQDNKSTKAIDENEFVFGNVEKEVTRKVLYLEIEFVLYLLRETWNTLKAVMEKG